MGKFKVPTAQDDSRWWWDDGRQPWWSFWAIQLWYHLWLETPGPRPGSGQRGKSSWHSKQQVQFRRPNLNSRWVRQDKGGHSNTAIEAHWERGRESRLDLGKAARSVQQFEFAGQRPPFNACHPRNLKADERFRKPYFLPVLYAANCWCGAHADAKADAAASQVQLHWLRCLCPQTS